MTGSTPALALDSVTKRYGSMLALDAVSFSLQPGEFVALLGPSGAGKSTVFRCLSKLVSPESGSVMVAGRDLADLRGRELRRLRRNIGLIFQQFNLIGRMSAIDNVLAGRLGHVATWRVVARRFPASERQRALSCLNRVGMLAQAYQRADSLSGGQQQRVAIARVLAQESTILLADEPVSSLDPRSAESVLGSLRDIAAEHGIAVLCALHQVEYARRFADRVVALRDGKLALDAPAALFDAAAFESLYGLGEAPAGADLPGPTFLQDCFIAEPA
ncbi:phosphonate ABC transporter ATP-binding protein [Bosea sp. R86505]|uniref:phosphonate ABC transporter ATP-binding protein n=1 Tax=Bosea sp. R86505 TaxID=3101710 RepID=UPI00366E610C